MKIFVTVGTTAFDKLIKKVDEVLIGNYQFSIQIAEGKYQPKNNKFFRFTQNIEGFYQEADLIISHGGAGTIFRVLELRKKLVIVPNLDRVDPHQMDICNYMIQNGHALSCINLDELSMTIAQALTTDFVPYVSEPFLGVSHMREFLGLSSKLNQ